LRSTESTSIADLALHREHLDLGLHARVDLLEPLAGREGFEQLLALLEFETQVAGDRVGQAAGVLDGGDGIERLRRHLLVELDEALEGRVDGADERLHLDRILLGLVDDLHLAGKEGIVALEASDARAALALHQHLDGAVGQAQQLDDGAQRSDGMDVVLGRLVLAGLALGAQQQLAFARHGVLERPDRLGPPHEERHHHVGEDHDVPQRQERDHARIGVRAPALGLVVVVVKDSHLW
jgi:hypothetical protein